MNIETLEAKKEEKLSRAKTDIELGEKEYTVTQRVAKNSFWLIIQPLILNFISIFVTGYIARTLGQADYGKFVFAFAFVAMFAPFANMGLRAITIRSIAEDKKIAPQFLGKILVLRVALILLAFILSVIIINLLNYPLSTRVVVYIAAAIMILTTISTTCKDTFEAFEKMQYVAYTNFVSGIVLTILSVLVLFVGYRLIGLSLVYLFGSLLGVIVGGWFLVKKFVIPKPKMDFKFWKKSIFNGRYFFMSSLVAMARKNIGILLLSKLGGNVAMGIYGAASVLTTRVAIIPDSVGTSVFPAISALHKSSKKETEKLVTKFIIYLFLISLPIAVGGTVLSKKIIMLIYGDAYQNSIIVLQIIIWTLPFLFLTYFLQAALGALHQQKVVVKISSIVIICSVLLNLLLVPAFKEIGVAIALVLTELLCLILMVYHYSKYFLKDLGIITNGKILKIIIANAIMGIILWVFKDGNLIFSFIIGSLAYILTLLTLRIITKNEFILLRDLVVKDRKYDLFK